LSAGARAKVLAIAEKQHPGKSIELVEKVDPALIGGVTIRIGDELYDGSCEPSSGRPAPRILQEPVHPRDLTTSRHG
jgi:hypothetical protein